MVAIADWVDNIHCTDYTLKSQVSSLSSLPLDGLFARFSGFYSDIEPMTKMSASLSLYGDWFALSTQLIKQLFCFTQCKTTVSLQNNPLTVSYLTIVIIIMKSTDLQFHRFCVNCNACTGMNYNVRCWGLVTPIILTEKRNNNLRCEFNFNNFTITRDSKIPGGGIMTPLNISGRGLRR